MNIFDRWTLMIVLTGILVGSLLSNINHLIVGDTYFFTIVSITAFMVGLFFTPAYSEMEEYWRRKYGK